MKSASGSTPQAEAKPLLYVVQGNLESTFVDQHHDWYERRHAPDLIRAGFFSARGFDGHRDPAMWNIYEVPDAQIFTSEAYGSVRANDPFVSTVVQHLSGLRLSLFSEIAALGRNGRPLDGYHSFSALDVVMMRFDCDDPTVVNRWFEQESARIHGRPGGPDRLRLWEQRIPHPKGPSTAPRWAATSEWNAVADDAETSMRSSAGRIDAIRNVELDTITRRFGLVREDRFQR